MTAPPAPITGSAKNAATVSGPSSTIRSSSAFAIRVAKASSLSAPPSLGPAVIVRALGVPHQRQRQAEVGVHVGFAGHADRGDGVAVIAVAAADDLVLLRSTHGRLVVPSKLDGGVVGLRARTLEQ